MGQGQDADREVPGCIRRQTADRGAPGGSDAAISGQIPPPANFTDPKLDELLAFFVDLLRQIILITDFLYLMQLRFNPIHMVFFIHNDMLQQLPTGIVSNL